MREGESVPEDGAEQKKKKGKVNQNHVREGKEMESARTCHPRHCVRVLLSSTYRWHTSGGSDCLFGPRGF